MNKTNVDWKNPKEGWELTHVWNPIIGCKRNCSKETHGFDCWARKMNNFVQWIPEWTKPQIIEKQYYEPKFPMDLNSTIWIGELSDICYWEYEWLVDVLIKKRQPVIYRNMFLTKEPRIYRMAEDCFVDEKDWLGLTVTEGKNTLEEFLEIKEKGNYSDLRLKPPNLFLSIEPLLGSFNDVDLSNVDLVIVGADSSAKPVVPKKEWIKSIQHDNIYFKNNIRKYL